VQGIKKKELFNLKIKDIFKMIRSNRVVYRMRTKEAQFAIKKEAG